MVKRIVSLFQQAKMSFGFVFIFVALMFSALFCFAWVAVYSLSLQVNNTTAVLATLFMVTASSYLIEKYAWLSFWTPSHASRAF